jgi:hypothetical protein
VVLDVVREGGGGADGVAVNNGEIVVIPTYRQS